MKILIRAGMSPLDIFDPTHIITQNSIGGNVGNLIYQYSVFRALMTENTTITPDYYKFEPSRAKEINENFDCYVIPLADAFRDDFVPSLRKYTKLIKKLTIPVYVIGVGLRAPFEPDIDGGFPFDEDVKAFVSAVLEKSTIIGVRGQITADYLTRLGFREGIDHTVIGCPSMYAFGRELIIRETNITKDSMVCINSSRKSPDNVLDFIDRSAAELPNHYFIPQWMKELILTYVGAPNVTESNAKNYPNKISHPMYMNDRVRYPLNAPRWIEFISQADFSFGARLHGNITAVLAGTPSLIIPKDARMRELTEYHNLTHVMANEITDKTNIWDLIEQADFQSVTKNQGRNFDHYINFLNQNGINHIYKDGNNPSSAPLDDAIAKLDLLPPLKTISGCTNEEIAARFERYYPVANKKRNAKEKELRKKVTEIESLLNKKSVRAALKVVNMISK